MYSFMAATQTDENSLKFFHLGMGDCNAVSDAGGADLFPFVKQIVEVGKIYMGALPVQQFGKLHQRTFHVPGL